MEEEVKSEKHLRVLKSLKDEEEENEWRKKCLTRKRRSLQQNTHKNTIHNSTCVSISTHILFVGDGHACKQKGKTTSQETVECYSWQTCLTTDNKQTTYTRKQSLLFNLRHRTLLTITVKIVVKTTKNNKSICTTTKFSRIKRPKMR